MFNYALIWSNSTSPFYSLLQKTILLSKKKMVQYLFSILCDMLQSEKQ